MSFRIIDQLGEALVPKAGIDDENERRPLHYQSNHGEVVDCIVRHRQVVQVLRIGGRIGEERVTVRRGPSGEGPAYGA